MTPDVTDPFVKDIISSGSYRYSDGKKLSSTLQHRRLTEMVISHVSLSGKKVLDIGCGDGTYTYELYRECSPSLIVGIDPIKEAINIATQKYSEATNNIRFEVGSAYSINYPNSSFDVAVVRAVLHHLEKPYECVREALRVAHEIIILEPNGLNLVLKILEKVNPYHLEHKEKSYTRRRIDSMITNAGGRIISRSYSTLVPCFCPDWMAITLKKIEGIVESIPFINQFICAHYTVVGRHNTSPKKNEV